MQIDNSRANAFRTCPWMYFEQYKRDGSGVQPISNPTEGYNSLEFGGRLHELMEEHLKKSLLYGETDNPELETEAVVMMEAYKAKYPNEEYEVVDIERPFLVGLPDFCPDCYALDFEVKSRGCHCRVCGGDYPEGRHQLAGKMDLVFRNKEGVLDIMDHKSQTRTSKSNLPQKWGAKDQASLYLWAAAKIYQEPIGNFYVNVLTRQSPAGMIGPTFPDRQKIERSQRDLECTIRDIMIVADDIERYTRIFGDKEWPANRENCYTWGYCKFYQLHRYGEDVTEILKHRFEPRKEYLDLSALKVIQ